MGFKCSFHCLPDDLCSWAGCCIVLSPNFLLFKADLAAPSMHRWQSDCWVGGSGGGIAAVQNLACTMLQCAGTLLSPFPTALQWGKLVYGYQLCRGRSALTLPL